MRQNLGLSAGVLAFLAVIFHVSNRPATERQAGSPISQTASQKKGAQTKSSDEPPPGETQIEGPWLATRAFFYREAGEFPELRDKTKVDFRNTDDVTRCATQDTCPEQLRAYFGIDDDCKPDFLVALVPDPLHTRLALSTDTTIDAIQKAAFAAEWEFATQWLPWTDDRGTDLKELAKRRAERASSREQEKQPGLLVFRHPKDDSFGFGARLLLVFIVGETPTAGVNGYQFKMARAYAEALKNRGRPRAPILIQGPNYSGSLFSLAKLVQEDKRTRAAQQNEPQYCVRTGTVTNTDYVERFKRETCADFRSTNTNGADRNQHFCKILGDLRIRPWEAAILTEDDTGFAHGVMHGLDTAVAGSNCNGQPIPELTFPRDISHLRNAYREAVAASRSENVPVPNLDFSLKDPDSGEDAVPTFSQTHSPILQNAMLSEVMNEIRRNRIRIVEVMGTNVLDLLFLSRLLRQQCPDTRLLVPFPDLLFAQAAQSEPLTGILALTGYPLFYVRRQWMEIPPGSKTPTTHAGTGSEGVYNATLLLLSRLEMNEDRHKRIVSRLQDYHWGTLLPHAPVWLMTLNRAGFSPVTVLTESQRSNWFENVPQSSDVKLILPPPSRIWILAMSLLATVGMAFSGWILYLHFDSHTGSFSPLATDQEGPADSARLLCLVACLLLLVAAQAILYLPLPLHPQQAFNPGIHALALVGMAMPLTVAVGILRGLWNRESAIYASILLSGFFATVLIWVWCCRRPGEQSFFFSFRALELQPGASPALPVLAATLALLTFWFVHLRRFSFVSNRGANVSVPQFNSPVDGYLKDSLDEFNRRAEFPLRYPWHRVTKTQKGGIVVTIFLSILIGAIFRVPMHLYSIDGWSYDVLSIGLQLVVITSLILTCLHVAKCWSSLRDFLNNLTSLPFATAFAPVCGPQSSVPIWMRRLPTQSLEVPIHSVTILHDMLLPQRRPFAIGPNLRDLHELRNNYRLALFNVLNLRETRDQETGVRKSRSRARKDYFDLVDRGLEASHWICGRILQPQWQQRAIVAEHIVHGQPTRSENRDGFGRPGSRDSYDLAQTFIALHFSTFVMYALRHIKNLILFLSLGFVLLVISMNSYNFQSQQTINRFLIVLFFALGYFTCRFLAQMERDPILSRISGSTVGELNKEFYLKAGSYGALPILGLLAAQFPSISNLLFSWIQPSLEAIH